MIQIPAVVVYGAISSLMGLTTKKYLVFGIIYGFVVEFGIGQIPTNINTLAMTNHLKSLLAKYPPLSEHLGVEPGSSLTAAAAIAAVDHCIPGDKQRLIHHAGIQSFGRDVQVSDSSSPRRE